MVTYRRELSDWRWWLVVSLSAAISFGIAWMLALILAFGISGNLGTPWDVIVVYAPFALAGVATAVIGEVRRWWLVIPAAVAYLLPLLEELVPLAMAATGIVLIVGSTALARWLTSGSSPRESALGGSEPHSGVRT